MTDKPKERKDYRMLITYKDNKPDKYHVVEMVKVSSHETRDECRKAMFALQDKDRME